MTIDSSSRAILLLAVALGCAGCPAMAITTAATTVAGATADDRSYEQQVDDEETKGSIEKTLLSNGPSLAADVDVYDGRVMLTGSVTRESQRRDAVSLARSAANPTTLYDDIQVVPPGGGSATGSGFVENKDLGARLLAADGIGSQSFQHRVVNGVAYILGEAHHEQQIEIARQTALGTAGVNDVVTHIELRR